MPVTFGSVGDIISVSLLIKDLVKSLDDSRGSSAEYRAVIRELGGLDRALLEVEIMFRSFEKTAELNAMTATVNESAEQCRNCIKRFHEQLKRYGRSLTAGGSGSFIRDTSLKIRWQVSEKENLAKFRAEINAHCFFINMLLTTTGMSVSLLDILTFLICTNNNSALAKANDENLQVRLKQCETSRTTSSATQSYELAEIKSRLEENNALVKAVAFETKEISSRFDMYVDIDRRLDSILTHSSRNYFKSLGADILLSVQKIL